MEEFATINDEVQLLGYGESDSYGPWVKLRLNDHDMLDKFRGQPCGTKSKLGKRYAAVLIEIGEDEKPVKPESVEEKKEAVKQGENCWLAIRMCNNENFKKFVEHQQFGGENQISADQYLKNVCRISSRKELDNDREAAARFRGLQQQYSTWVAQQGLV